MAGPLRPRWVKSSASRKAVLPWRISAGAAMPASGAMALEQRRLERQRHEAGAGFEHGQTELLGNAIGKAGGAHLRDRLAAGRDDQR
jgi:hypothetical protein